ncbi:oligosaccharide flippase family protein, partial [Candidatus Curtissbacteria bacterium]|nr:oligosaccharide flippase family protein [Candidatus Curtissbacteria bacterium]
NVVFYTAAIVLAQNNFGIASFTWAVLLRGLVGLLLIYIISPWKPTLSIDKTISKKLISFGVPFQLNSILALLKDDLLTILLGKILSFTQIGYLGWAQKWSFTPLRFFMDNLIKVTFPAYSRLQDEKTHLKSAIEKSLFFVTFTVYPTVVGILVIAPIIVNLVPKYQKWETAIPLLYFYGINAIFAAVNTTLTNILFALGKPKIILKLMVFWTILTWLLTFALYKLLGYQGVAIASALVAASTSITIYFVKKEVNISVISSVKVPLLASIVMYFVLSYLQRHLGSSVLSLVSIILTGVIIYSAMLLAYYRSKLIADLKVVVNTILKKG